MGFVISGLFKNDLQLPASLPSFTIISDQTEGCVIDAIQTNIHINICACKKYILAAKLVLSPTFHQIQAQ